MLSGLQCSFSYCRSLPNCALTTALRLLRKPAQRDFCALLWQGLYRAGKRYCLRCFGGGFALLLSGLQCSFSYCRSLPNCALTTALRLLRKPAQRDFCALLWQGLNRAGKGCGLRRFSGGFAMLLGGLRCSFSDCGNLLNCALTTALRLLRKPAQRHFSALLRYCLYRAGKRCILLYLGDRSTLPLRGLQYTLADRRSPTSRPALLDKLVKGIERRLIKLITVACASSADFPEQPVVGLLVRGHVHCISGGCRCRDVRYYASGSVRHYLWRSFCTCVTHTSGSFCPVCSAAYLSRRTSFSGYCRIITANLRYCGFLPGIRRSLHSFRHIPFEKFRSFTKRLISLRSRTGKHYLLLG